MGIVVRHEAVGIPLRRDNSRFNAGMQMVQRQQERDQQMRNSQVQPLKYNTGGTYGGIGIGDQKKKADPALLQEPQVIPSWQEDNEEIRKMIDAGGFGYGVSRQLTNLIERENTLRNNTRLNDAQKAEGLARIQRNKDALVGTSSLDPGVANAVRDNPPDDFDVWAAAHPTDYVTQYNNARTQWMEQNPGKKPDPSQIVGLLREPWDARKPKPAQPPAAAVGDDNPYDSKLDEVLNELQKQQGIGERRYGGPVYPGQTVTVGEEGPEVMRVGYDGVAQVAPNPATMARMQGGMSQPMNYAANPQGGSALQNYDDMMFLAESVVDAAQPAPAASKPQQAQPKADPLEGMTQRQIAEMYAYNRAQQNAAPATESDRVRMGQQAQQRTAPAPQIPHNPDGFKDELAKTARGQQIVDKIDAETEEYNKWKYNEAHRLYMQRPVSDDTPSITKQRTWTDNRGNKIKGDLRGVRHFNDGDQAINEVAVIRTTDGKTHAIPLQDLSSKDQAIVTQTPDYASETRLKGKNQGTYLEKFNPDTPEGQRRRQPQPRQTPTPEQLETRRSGEFGFGGVDAGIREGRLGRRRETPPAYQQPVLGDGQIATVPGLASPPGTRTVGPNGERLPPAGANADPRDVNTYTQWLAHLGPTEGAKFTASLKKKGMWGSRYSITEKLLAQEGLLKKRGVDGYGKPYESPSQEPQFQPPARPGWYDSWRDPNAQERRLTPAELAQRGLMVNPQGQVVQMPRDPQGRPVMPAPPVPQTAAQTPAKKFDPTSPMASRAINTLLREHTQEEHANSLNILAQLNAPADFVASLTGRIIKPGESPAAKPKEPGFSLVDPQDRSPLDVLRRAIGLRGSSTSQGEPSSQEPTQKDIEGMTAYLQSGRASAEEKQIITDILRNAGVNVNDIKTSASPAKPPTAPQQGFPTPDAMASQVAQQQTQKREPSALPKKQPGVQDQEFWIGFWSSNRPAYEAPKNQKAAISTLTSADGKQTMRGVVGRISEPMEELGGQRVVTFQREDGAVVTFYSGQLSQQDQERMEKNLTPDKRLERSSKDQARGKIKDITRPGKYAQKTKKPPAKSVETITPVTGPVAWDGGKIPSKKKDQ